MSFGFKLLSWIVAINVAITGLLLWAILSNIHGQSLGYRSNAARSAEQRQEIIRRLEELLVFQNRMSERELADVRASTILGWDEWRLCQDAMVLLNYVEIDGEIVHRDIRLNPLGKLHRTFDEAKALEVLETAIEENRPVFHEDDAEPGLVFIALPIFHRATSVQSFGPEITSARRPWGAALVQPRFPAFEAPVDYFNWELFWLAMAGGTVTLIVVTFIMLSRLVIRPVKRMARVADLVAQGDYSVQCSGRGSRDEVGRLTDSFNFMLSEVRDYHQHLEVRIDEAQARVQAAERHLMIAQRLAATGKLAAGIAHEINNPIGGMINAALTLKEKRKGSGAESRTDLYLDLIVEGLERIKDIVRKVLIFTPRSLQPAEARLIEILQDARALVSYQLEKSGIEFALSVEPKDLQVYCEAGELRQVFLNLILNAIDAVKDAGGGITIHAERREGDRKVCVSLSDDGCGMTAEELSRAFDLFYTTKEVGKGTGLGLSVAQNIVMNHGGIIEAESEPGKGTTIRVILPAR